MVHIALRDQLFQYNAQRVALGQVMLTMETLNHLALLVEGECIRIHLQAMEFVLIVLQVMFVLVTLLLQHHLTKILKMVIFVLLAITAQRVLMRSVHVLLEPLINIKAKEILQTVSLA